MASCRWLSRCHATACPWCRSAGDGRDGSRFLTISPEDGLEVLHGLASPVRLRILKFLHGTGPSNVNAISEALSLPQSTVATNIQVLENAGLVATRTFRRARGSQKICSFRFEEIVLHFSRGDISLRNAIEVSMPIGLYTACAVTAPCGLCSTERVLGLLDVPDSFLQPERMQAALLWFGRGYVEYKFPNNAHSRRLRIATISFSMELSSEVPGTNTNWPSDISLWVNDIRLGVWTSSGRLRRQARRLHAELVEAGWLPIRPSCCLARQRASGTFLNDQQGLGS